MEYYRRQQFDSMLAISAESFVERIVQRCGGGENALNRLREDPQGDGIWLDEYVDAVFEEWLLNEASGSVFVLESLQKRPFPAVDQSGTVGEVMVRTAKRVYADLLRDRVVEVLGRQLAVGV